METPSLREPPIFIVGCGRSGTTLLRLLLNAHPDLAVPPEAQFVERLAARRDGYVRPGGDFDAEACLSDLIADPRFREWELPGSEVRTCLPPAPGFADVIGAAFRAYAAARGKPRWGDKTPDHVRCMPLLAGLWPDARFVHLIRDGRDVAGSLAGTPFGPKTVVGQARYWAKRVRAGRSAGAELGPDRYLEVRYESLVSDTRSELERICAFVDLPFDPSMLAHHERSAGTIPQSELGHQARALEPVSAGMRDWSRDMGRSEVATFESAEGRLLTELGYALAGGFAAGAWARARAQDAREALDLRRRVRRATGRVRGRA